MNKYYVKRIQSIGRDRVTEDVDLEFIEALPLAHHTTVERDAISSPVIGTMLYNIDTNDIDVWNGTAWKQVKLI